MAYKTEKLFEDAMHHIKEKKLFFFEDVIAYLGIGRNTFYDHFPIDSNNYDIIKRELDNNKVAIKTSMRKKWYDSDNATLQVALMKLISTDEERKKLSNTYIDNSEIKVNSENNSFTITRKVISDDSTSSE